MANHQSSNGNSRFSFSKIHTFVPIPNLIEVQRQSYESFLQMNLPGSKRKDIGLQSVFNSVFPISDFRDTASLEFSHYTIGNWECRCGNLDGIDYLPSHCAKCGANLLSDGLHTSEIVCHECSFVTRDAERCEECGEPVALNFKYSIEECQEQGMTYAVPLKVTFRLVVFDKDQETGQKSIRDIKEQAVYFGEIPIMTEKGTFVINGTERVIVNQLHRSPGVFFQANKARSEFIGKIIPYRGSWVEFEYDTAKNICYVRIDRKRKFPATVFLRALGLISSEEIMRTFYRCDRIDLERDKIFFHTSPNLMGVRAVEDVKAGRTKIVEKGRKISATAIRKMEDAGVERIQVSLEEIEGAISVADVVVEDTGEILLEANQLILPENVEAMREAEVASFEVAFPYKDILSVTLHNTLKKDTVTSPEEARIEIYKRLRPGDPPTADTSRAFFENMFFDPRRYDFSRVGRLKFNTKLDVDTDLDEKILYPEDFFQVMNYLLRLQNPGSGAELDDIDHLGNRRVRSVGELLENQFRIGLVRMEIAIKEKMSVHRELTTATPQDIVNAKPVMAAIQEFFGSSQLSQFMDQTNPLSEVTHKRRLSALGPGGLSRERAGFEVRDVHPTHYGRICPIETPEGPNIGLISSLSCYARINPFGFIESPYRKVESGRVVDYYKILQPHDTKFEIGQIVPADEVRKVNTRIEKQGARPAEVEPHCFYLTAWEEDQYVIAQANAELDEIGRFVQDLVTARHQGTTILTSRDKVDYIDVSPKQLVSVATSLIPFLENDDANRALMGSNMQRQAVPLLRAESPIVGTGMEKIAAVDSGAVIICRRSGVVDRVDSERIIVRVEEDGEGGHGKRGDFGADIYHLVKFKRSNQDTCINQRPIIQVGDRVEKGKVIADGPCTEMGELALGRNILVCFMPWRGYNFEDAVLVSEKLVKEDYYTSIHIEEFDIEARDTKLGPEEITRDIPNVSEAFLRNLDDAGIIRIGAYVRPGEVLVGKVTPKGETLLTPEEKLLRAIFGEKSGEVRDASLLTPPGIEGTVVDVKVFARKGVEKDSRQLAIEEGEIGRLQKNLEDEIRVLQQEARESIMQVLRGHKAGADVTTGRGEDVELVIEKGGGLTEKRLEDLSLAQLKSIQVEKKEQTKVDREIAEVERRMKRKIEVSQKLVENKVAQMQKGYELAPGVRKMVKAYVAMKRKLSVGDKMAGRHGNKGVIAKILPEEDMPHLPDGTPVEICLNPLGVPSRMNVGQILETHLGWAGHVLGLKFASPVFDGANESEIRDQLEEAGLPVSGKSVLYDGRSGEPFEQKVTVGYIYMLKLSHLVDDKIHARSIGPYSLITQQPLGGKAQFGGQRFGEMEVWALEAYGAAHTLQEILTCKSDDVFGRTKIYESIVKGEIAGEPGIPESFNVLVKELQALGLDVELFTDKDMGEAETA